MVKNGDIVEYQYGDWLKSSGGHPRSPPRRDNTQRTASDDDITQNTIHTLVVEKSLTAKVVAADLPSDKDGDKAVSLGITVDSALNEIQGIASESQHAVLHGIVLDSQQNGLGSKGAIDNVSNGVSTGIVGQNNGDTSLTEVGSMDTSVPNANWASDCDGPSLLKTRAKWGMPQPYGLWFKWNY